MRLPTIVLALLFFFAAESLSRAAKSAFGADLSFLKQAEARGKGIFWREPAVGNRGCLVSRRFFEENGNSLPVLSVFDRYPRPAPRTGGQ